MRQETINICTIEDHPNKDLCFDWIRENWHDLAQHSIDELIDSLKALASHVNGDLDYAISAFGDRGEFIKITDYQRGALEDLFAKRDECPLTGVCYDHDVIEALYNDELESKILSLIHEEAEYIYSDEGLSELCAANEYEFYECGKAV